MIAIHDKNDVLIKFGKCIGQFPDEIIHFLNLVYIVFKLIPTFLIFDTGYCNQRFFNYLIGRIGTMPLDGYRIDKILFVRRFQYIHNLLCQNLVLYPLKRCVFGRIHIFHTGKGINAKVLKYLVSRIEGCIIIMDHMRSITIIPQYIGNTFTGGFFQYCLIWELARSEIFQVHAGHHLKFSVCRTISDIIYREKSGRIFFLQLIENRCCLFRQFQIFYFIYIKEGFQL